MSQDTQRTGFATLVGAAVLAVGMVAAAWLIGAGLTDLRTGDRSVTVKGLAEREVRANLAIWPVVYSAAGNDLATVQGEIEADAERIIGFLTERGFARETITRSAPRITDYQAQGYSGGNRPLNRYTAEATVLLRTDDVDGVLAAQQDAGALVSAGVVLMNQWGAQTQFLFTELNAIKPDMIAQATRNGREAARRFAEDSGTAVGALRRARQGLFTITDRDPHSPDYKRIRVVSTLEYNLTSE